MTLHVCQDGDKFYVQNDPEDETWLACFNSESEADAYVLSCLGNCKNHEDPEECDHSDYIVKVGDSMESGEIDGSYMIPFFCEHCNHFVYEEYSYEGIVLA